LGSEAARKRVVMVGHMDTVPGAIAVHQEGDRLYGRGTVDAKGPLATFVIAAARTSDVLVHTAIDVIGTVGEEASAEGARHLARTMPAPEFAVIGEPSGWQGITLGYKGMLSAIYRLETPARHTASDGASPAEQAVDFWNRLTAWAVKANEGCRGRFDALDPSLQAMRTFDGGLSHGVEMSLGLRLPPGADASELKRQMRDWSDGAELDFPYQEPAFVAEKNTPLVRALLRGIRATGGIPSFKLKSGTSDMNVVGPAWGCPMVAYGPGDSSLDHTPDEHIEIPEYLQGIDVLTEALKLLAS